MAKFNFITIGPTAGDCTTPYELQFNKTMTVKEFIDEVLTRHEWGEIYIHDQRLMPYRDFVEEVLIHKRGYHWSYKDTKLESKIPDDILDQTILSATAQGGWSLMDYILTIESSLTTGGDEKKVPDDPMYLCNPLANKECRKTSCFWKDDGAPCFRTNDVEFAARDANGNPIVWTEETK